jgi:O-antigen/teichoic acid export membrane protein
MGEQYAQVSGTVMQILLLSVVFGSATTTAGGIVYGMGQHKRIAFWGIGEAAANLILSVILVRRIGVYGVAWGTTIPSVIIEVLLWPVFISRLVKISVRTFLWETWFRPSVAVIPFTLACVAAERYWPARNLFWFFLQIAVLLPLVPLALGLVFRKEAVTQTKVWMKRRKAANRLNHEYETSTTTVG